MSNGQKIIRRIAGATDIALYTGEHLLIGRPSVFGPEFREMIASHKPGLTERVILNIHKYASHGAGRLHGVLIEIDGIGGVPLSMRGIVERVAGLVRRGTLLALVMPAVALNALTTDSAQLEEMSADLARQEGVNPELSIEGKSFSDLDGMTDKLVYVLKASGKYFKLQSVATAFGKALTATAIISIAVVLAAWAASHFFGVGFAVDVILVAIGFVMMGWAIFSAVRSLWKCVKSIHKAKSLDDLEKAAKMFADTVTQFGVDFFVGLLTRGAGKMRAKKANAKPDAGGGKADTPQKTKAEIEAENKGKADKAKKTKDEDVVVGGKSYKRYDGDGPLYRGDSRPPEKIFDEGFESWAVSDNIKNPPDDLAEYVAKNTKGPYVSTSKDVNVASGTFSDGKYVYKIDPRGQTTIDVNKSLGPHSLQHEMEVAFLDKIPSSAIKGAHPVLPDGTLGELIKNPKYIPGI